jgi:hypothetical protein
MEQLEEGYYIVNGKRLLYWSGEEWMKPVKNTQGYYGYLAPLRAQPKRIKSIEPTTVAI